MSIETINNGESGLDVRNKLNNNFEHLENTRQYTHDQAVASAVRTITHNLGYRPNYIAKDTTGDQIVGTPARPSMDEMTITFTSETSGVAYLS